MTEELENPFGGFKFLDKSEVEKKVVETKPEDKEKPEDKKLEDGELSAEAEEALEKQAKAQADAIDKKRADDAKSKLEKETKEALEADDKKDKKKVPEPKKKVVEELEEELEEEEDDEDGAISDIISHMQSRGILDVAEGEEIKTEEDLERIQSNTINNGINKYKDSIPEDGKKFLDYLEAGGNASDFHKGYYGEESFEGYTPETEDDQKYIIREGLREEGYSEEDISEELEAIEDGGRIERKSATFLRKLQKLEAGKKKLLLQNQKDSAKKEDDKKKEEFKAFKERLFESEELAGFKLDKKTKTDLWDYMTKSNKKTGQTGYQDDMKADGDVKYIFAYLLKNKWDMSSLEEIVETKQAGKLRNKLSRYTDTRTKLKTGKRIKKAPPKDENNPFGGFKHFV